jgi:tetratricopeptide (TPR) repeat protein
MKHLLVTLCCLVWLASDVTAQSPSGDPKAWKRYQSAGEKALKAKDSLEAERQFALAVAEAEKIRKGESKLKDSLDDLAPLLVNHRKYDEAQAAYERLCALHAKDLGSNHLKVAECLFGLADAHRFANRLFEAEEALLQAKAIVERKTEPTHTARILVRGSLASVHAAQGRFADAEALYKSAIELAENPRVHYKQYADGQIVERRYLPPYQLLGSLRNDLGLLYSKQHRWAEAEDSFNRAQRLYQQGGGKENSGVALAMANRGTVYLEQKKFAEAEQLLTAALALREKAFAPNHPIIAETLKALAAAQQHRDPELAKATIRRAMQIQAAASPPIFTPPSSL